MGKKGLFMEGSLAAGMATSARSTSSLGFCIEGFTSATGGFCGKGATIALAGVLAASRSQQMARKYQRRESEAWDIGLHQGLVRQSSLLNLPHEGCCASGLPPGAGVWPLYASEIVNSAL